MNFDSIVEKVAFGRTIPKFNSCLGLYLSPDVLFLSEVHAAGGKPVVDHLLRIPVSAVAAWQETPARQAGSLNAEFLADPNRIAGLVKQTMGHVRWNSRYLMVSLSHHFGLVRYFTMPSIARQFWQMAIPTEAKKYIPIPFEELTRGFQASPLPPGPDRRPRMGVLFGVAHNKIMEGMRNLARKLDLTLVGLELSPCSVERLWDVIDGSSDAPPTAHIYVEGVSVRILLSENGIPIFFREVQLGDEAGNLDRRKMDLTGSIDFTRKQLNAQKPVRVRVEGAMQDIGGWKEVLGQETGLPAEIRDTAKNLGLKAGEWGGYAAIGGALRHLAPTRISLTIGNFGQVQDEDRRAATAILGLGGVLTAIFLLGACVCKGFAVVKEHQLAKISQAAAMPAFQGKTAKEVQKILGDMEKQADSVSAFTGSRIKVAKIFEQIAEIIPDSLWLTNLHYDAVVGGGGLADFTQKIDLTGHAAGSDSMAEQDAAIQFRVKLMSHPEFGKTFSCGGVAVQTAPLSAANAQANSFSAGRTTFTLQCIGKKG